MEMKKKLDKESKRLLMKGKLPERKCGSRANSGILTIEKNTSRLLA